MVISLIPDKRESLLHAPFRAAFVSLQYIKKMGLQGPPGFMFSMNGEEIHIGKSGMYEVEGINISNLSFVIKNISPIPYEDNLDYFIMDFLY